MILRNSNGEEIYKTKHKTLKETLAFCAKKGVDLSGLCIRNAKITKACLDGLVAPNAVFWGCDFRGSDIGYANLSGCDLRICDFEGTCFSGSDLTGANMRGAYFGDAIFDGTTLDDVQISCPSFWSCDVYLAKSIKNMVFCDRGERDIVLNSIPLILQQNGQKIIIMDQACLWRGNLYPIGYMQQDLAKELFQSKTIIERLLAHTLSQTAKKPMPKIPSEIRRF